MKLGHYRQTKLRPVRLIALVMERRYFDAFKISRLRIAL